MLKLKAADVDAPDIGFARYRCAADIHARHFRESQVSFLPVAHAAPRLQRRHFSLIFSTFLLTTILAAARRNIR